MSHVGVLPRLHNAVGNLVSCLSLFRLSAVATFWPMSPVGIYPGRASFVSQWNHFEFLTLVHISHIRVGRHVLLPNKWQDTEINFSYTEIKQGIMVDGGPLKTMENFKTSAQKVFLVVYEQLLPTRSSAYSNLTRKSFVFWLSGCLRIQEVVA